MLTRRQLAAFLVSTSLGVAASGRTAAQTGHNPSTAATPEPEPGAEWSADEVQRALVGGFPSLLSPTGAHIAGFTEGRHPTVWDLETGELVATQDNAVVAGPDAPWGAWSPDGSAFAWACLEGPGARRISVFDLTTGVTTVVSDDQPDAGYTDSLPCWSTDGETIAFVREPDAAERRSVNIMEVTPDGGGMGMVARDVAGQSGSISNRLHRLADNSLVFATAHDPSRAASQMPGIWRLQPDGTMAQFVEGSTRTDSPQPLVLDAALIDSTVSVIGTWVDAAPDAPAGESLCYLVTTGDGEPVVTNAHDLPGIPTGGPPVSLATFTPDGRGIVTLGWNDGGVSVGMLDLGNAQHTALYEIPHEAPMPLTDVTTGWSQDGLLLIHMPFSGATLLRISGLIPS